MKIYKSPDKVVIQGKAWQVLHLLKAYRKQYERVREWTREK
ncbi:Z-ring formation inhibitor MciZ [Salicibibacter cibarius]|uniref:Z-ring formation inhibitor MciZ n=1 Tax=Salicibibacter cibarius TaxID=2743000 RepID=A0A7T7CBL2_9BACI|nr:Z-ring formation inhibitor MciZ [Salicibibacter cibarius]QQK75949.1 Z-ring formation inhibitor MciZ [Salicibibacter cibarius]